MYERGRKTERDEDRLSYWPITSSSSLDHTMLCHLQGVTYLPLLPHRAPGGPSPWLTISRPKTPDRRLTPARYPVSTMGHVYLILQSPNILVVTHKCVLQSNSLHSWNVWVSQSLIWNTYTKMRQALYGLLDLNSKNDIRRMIYSKKRNR